MTRRKLPSHPSHPLYVPGLISTAQVSSLDWSKIINTPTTRDGYGLTDVYTEAEANALFSLLGHTHTFASLTAKPTTIAGYGITDFNSLGDARWAALVHTHAASDITSGVLAVARLGTGTPDGTKFLRDDGTFVTPSGGGSGPGSGTTDFLPKWDGAGTALVDSLLSDDGTDITIGGALIPDTDSVYDLGSASKRLRNMYQAGGSNYFFSGDAHGLFIMRAGANNWQLRSNDDGASNQVDATKPSWVITVGEGAADNFSIYRRPAAGAFALLWKADANGNWLPGATGSFDVGSSGLAVHDVWLSNILHLGSAIASTATFSQRASDSAGFTNSATDTGLSFTALANKDYIVDAYLPINITSTNGIKFAFVVPASATGEMTVCGSLASLASHTSLYSTTIATMTATAFLTAAITGYVRIMAVIRISSTAGTVKIQAQTGAVGSTAIIKKGAWLKAVIHGS